jgi:hypothetical protein
MLFDDRRACLAMGKAGRYRADVAPGGTIVLTFVVPAIHLPGRHVLQFDLIEEQHCFFHEAGSEPLEVEVEVEVQ